MSEKIPNYNYDADEVLNDFKSKFAWPKRDEVQAGQFKEESAAWISESFSGSCNAESLARKSAAEKPEFWHCFWVCFSCIFYEPLSLRVKQGVVTAVGVFVDFAVSYACKASGTGQSLAETADAGEHIHELDQGHNSR